MNFLSMKAIFGIAGFIAIAGVLTYAGQTLYSLGYDQAEAKFTKEKLEAVTRAIAETNQINQQNAEVLSDYLDTEAQTKVKIQPIEKEIIKYVDRIKTVQVPVTTTCEPNPDELRLLDTLIDTVNHNLGDTQAGN